MPKRKFAALFISFVAAAAPACAADADSFHVEHVYGTWSKGRFADAVTVKGPAKTIYVSGIGAEDPKDGHILYPDNFYQQCKMAYGKISDALAKQGATLADIVKTTVYVTDMKNGRDFLKCRDEALNGAPISAQTAVGIAALAHPNMLIEVDVTAAVAAK